jgi:1,2-diacylglycerol 3-alpha-glucosyltransferase
MKIGLFTDTYYPQINGVATSVLMLKENLEKLGHSVYVFTTTDPKADKNEKNVFRVASVPFKSSRRVGMFYNPLLSRRIKRLGLDIIHTNTEFSLGIFGRTIAKELNIPLVHTYHTIYEDYTHYIVKFGVLDTIAKKTARKLSENFCNSVDSVIVPTEKVKDLLRSYNVYKPINVIPSGIKLDKYSKANFDSSEILKIKNSLGIDKDDKVILYIGRISEEKNIKELLIGMQSYFKKNDNIKFLLVGDGPDREKLENLSQDLGISNRTIFAGERPWDEIGKYYQLGDVFVSASQSETQGLTFIEALASGLPVIAKKDRCLEGVIEVGYNGYMYSNLNEFYKYLDMVLKDKDHMKKLKDAAVKSTGKFSAMSFAQKIEEQYQKVIRAKKYRKAS